MIRKECSILLIIIPLRQYEKNPDEQLERRERPMQIRPTGCVLAQSYASFLIVNIIYVIDSESESMIEDDPLRSGTYNRYFPNTMPPDRQIASMVRFSIELVALSWHYWDELSMLNDDHHVEIQAVEIK